MAAKKRARAKTDRRKPQRFLWTQQRLEAAQLLAEDDLTDVEIAAKVGVAVRQIYEWKAKPEFADRVQEIVKKLGDISMRRVIARKSRRLLALEDRWLRMQRIIEERAVNPAVQDAPGGKTGLLVRRQRMLGSGDNATLIEEFEVDIALLRELRETEKQAAQECGQWTEKRELTGKNGGPIEFIEVSCASNPPADSGSDNA